MILSLLIEIYDSEALVNWLFDATDAQYKSIGEDEGVTEVAENKCFEPDTEPLEPSEPYLKA